MSTTQWLLIVNALLLAFNMALWDLRLEFLNLTNIMKGGPMLNILRKEKETKSEYEIQKEKQISVKAAVDAKANADFRPGIVEKQSSLFAEYQKAHEEDKASYRFECKRNGDFLQMDITRGRLPVRENILGKYQPENKLSTSINLANVMRIDMEEGAEPSLTGKRLPCEYCNYSFVSDTLLQSVIENTRGALRSIYPILTEKWQMTVDYKAELKSQGYASPTWGLTHYTAPRPLRGGDDKLEGFTFESYGETLCGDIVENCAVTAMDDVLVFKFIHHALYVPHGLGEMVRQKIMDAISHPL